MTWRNALAGALAPAGGLTRLLSRPLGQNLLTLVALGLMIIVCVVLTFDRSKTPVIK